MRYRQLESALRRACDERRRFRAALVRIERELRGAGGPGSLTADVHAVAKRALEGGRWREGKPPRAGVYRVKCGGGGSPNAGWRHFDGDNWGNWSPSRAGAAARAKNPGRRARILRPVLWLDMGGAQ